VVGVLFGGVVDGQGVPGGQVSAVGIMAGRCFFIFRGNR